jgi:hypothetical protein
MNVHAPFPHNEVDSWLARLTIEKYQMSPCWSQSNANSPDDWSWKRTTDSAKHAPDRVWQSTNACSFGSNEIPDTDDESDKTTREFDEYPIESEALFEHSGSAFEETSCNADQKSEPSKKIGAFWTDSPLVSSRGHTPSQTKGPLSYRVFPTPLHRQTNPDAPSLVPIGTTYLCGNQVVTIYSGWH